MPTLEDPNLEEKAGYGEPEVPSYSEPDPQPRPMGIPVPDAPRLQPVKPLDQQQRANDMLANYQKVGSSSFPAANGGSSAPQGGRDYLERQNSLAKSVTPLGKGGSTGAIAGAVASKVPTSVDDLAKAGVQKLIGNSAGAQRIAGAVDTAQKAVRAIYGGDIKAGAELLIKYWKVVVALILAAELPFLLIAIAIAASLGSVGNPAGGVPVSANTQYVSARCAEMQSTLPYKNSNGKTDLLTLFATEGQFSKEQPYDVEKAPKKENPKGGGGISLDSYRSQDPSSPHYFPDSWKPYYASGRWGYTASRFDVGPIGHDPSTKIFPGVSSGADYAGRKIIFYNPANGKAAVAIAMDWGPNTGVFKDRSSSNLEQQRQLWNGAGSLDGYRITNPPNDPTALVGGGPDTLATALGVDQYSQVEMGFATDQSVDPTKPFKCTPVTTGTALQSTGQIANSGHVAADCLNKKVANEAAAKENLTSISFNAWISNKHGGAKQSKQMSLQVNKCAATSLKNALEQIYQDPLKYALYDSGGAIGTYAWRCKRRDKRPDDWCGADIKGRSVHSWGLAIDINPDMNPFQDGPNPFASSGSPFAIQADGPVVKIMAQNGWFWGGNWHGSKDYMHFSPLNE